MCVKLARKIKITYFRNNKSVYINFQILVLGVVWTARWSTLWTSTNSPLSSTNFHRLFLFICIANSIHVSSDLSLSFSAALFSDWLVHQLLGQPQSPPYTLLYWVGKALSLCRSKGIVGLAVTWWRHLCFWWHIGTNSYQWQWIR